MISGSSISIFSVPPPPRKISNNHNSNNQTEAQGECPLAVTVTAGTGSGQSKQRQPLEWPASQLLFFSITCSYTYLYLPPVSGKSVFNKKFCRNSSSNRCTRLKEKEKKMRNTGTSKPCATCSLESDEVTDKNQKDAESCLIFS